MNSYRIAVVGATGAVGRRSFARWSGGTFRKPAQAARLRAIGGPDGRIPGQPLPVEELRAEAFEASITRSQRRGDPLAPIRRGVARKPAR